MTADNLTFSLEIDFIPDIQEGRMDLKAKMKEVAAKYAGTYVLDPKARPIISGLSKEDVENALKDLGLQEDILRFRTVPGRCTGPHGQGMHLLPRTRKLSVPGRIH